MAQWHNSQAWAKARAYAKTVLEPICVSCGAHLIGGDWTIDHIIPAGDGEPNHDITNLQSMCRQCNGRKQDRTAVRANWVSPRWRA
jgi:5-methylcytosine-specific restriction endonuclease McrA